MYSLSRMYTHGNNTQLCQNKLLYAQIGIPHKIDKHTHTQAVISNSNINLVNSHT